MKALLQRVSKARVSVADEDVAAIDHGLLVFLGVEEGDSEADALVLARKLVGLRVFPGREPGRPPMDLDVRDVAGSILVVSQFTLAGRVRKGRRPSFDAAMAPERAQALYQRFTVMLSDEGITVRTGRFGAHMHVELLNDGPVTLLLEARDGVIV